MSKVIEQSDIDVAIRMIHLSIFGEEFDSENDEGSKKKSPSQKKKADDEVMLDDGDIEQPTKLAT